MALAETSPIPDLPLEAEGALPSNLETGILVSMYGMALAVREQVQHDVAVWQELPLLAMRANGRNGRYDPDLSALSDHGFYRLADEPSFPHKNTYGIYNLFGYFVDCETGSIIRITGSGDAQGNNAKPAEISELFSIIGVKATQGRLSDFSALAVRAKLQAQIDKVQANKHVPTHEANRLAYVELEIAKRGLTNKFTREMRR